VANSGVFSAQQGVQANPGRGSEFLESASLKLVGHEHVALWRW
jgi:hypothetical protein